MPALDMVFTDVGRAAIIAASGVDPVTITEVAVGDSGYTATASQTALVNELYRLTTVSGTVSVDEYTMTFNVLDESANAYTLREFGLYSDAGDLIAVYSQTDPILEKSSGSFLSLIAEVVLETIDAASVTFGDTNFNLPTASTTIAGLVELATSTEGETGTDTARALTPAAGKALIERYGLGGNAYDSSLIVGGSPSFNDSALYNTNGFFQIAGTWSNGPDGTSTYTGVLQTIRRGSDGVSAIIQNLWVNDNHYVRRANLTGGSPTWGTWYRAHTTENFVINSEIPAGVILPWSLVTPPSGWLECNGAAFSTVSYPELAIGYPGGTLPDLRGEFLRGWDNGRGVDTGRSILTAQSESFAAHNHASPKTQAGNSGTQSPFGSTGGTRHYYSGHPAGSSVSNLDLTSTTGGSETRPRNVAFMFIVRAR